MLFRGRDREIAAVTAALAKGQNLILTGKYGIGKTTLIRRSAEINAARWQFLFADFAKTPAQVCRDVLAGFGVPKHTAGRSRSIAYKSGRGLLADLGLRAKRRCILVLDNIAKLTPPRLDLIRYLVWDRQFLFIAIPERFLSQKDLFKLRACLYPSRAIRLRYLNADQTTEFFRHCARKHRLGWTESDIRMLTRTTKGYPLAMQEFVTREIERRK